jgi:hypothetical protein
MWASQVYNWCLKLRLVALENDLQPIEVDVRRVLEWHQIEQHSELVRRAQRQEI